jgi:hypothetical protein
LLHLLNLHHFLHSLRKLYRAGETWANGTPHLLLWGRRRSGPRAQGGDAEGRHRSELVLTWWAKILTLLPKQRSDEKPRPRLDEDERAAGDLRAWEEPCVGGSLSTYGERVQQYHTAYTGQHYTDALCAVRAVGVHANCHVSRQASVWAPPGPCVAAESMVCLSGG